MSTLRGNIPPCSQHCHKECRPSETCKQVLEGFSPWPTLSFPPYWRKQIFFCLVVKAAWGVSLKWSTFLTSGHSFEWCYRAPASRSYHSTLGLGLIVMQSNIESHSEIWNRPQYKFYKSASWLLFIFVWVFFPFLQTVEALKGADELLSLSLLLCLWGVRFMFSSWLCRGEDPWIHNLAWIDLAGKWLKAYCCPILQMAYILVLIWWAACRLVG